MEDTSTTDARLSDVSFRANKRRKVFRKRNADDESSFGNENTVAAEHESGDAPTSALRRPLTKKHGVIFSTAGGQTSSGDDAASTETALVPADAGGLDTPEQPGRNERFVKPIGRVVVEDKHLTAYVDSKLAEMRSSSSTPLQDTTSGQLAPTMGIFPVENDGQMQPTVIPSTVSNPEGQGERKGYAYGSRNPRQPKRRRQPATRDESALARDAMVDQILREGEGDIPIYAPRAPNNNTNSAAATDDGDYDADEAAAVAFKARFLANLEDRNIRRRAPAPPANSRNAPQVPSGPKLGGSRAQREKMRALQEEKGNAAGGVGKK